MLAAQYCPYLVMSFGARFTKRPHTCVRYGLVYPGVGWIVWRNRSCVDESLIFHVNYLGTDQPSLNLNFSKNANMIVAQYYQVGP